MTRQGVGNGSGGYSLGALSSKWGPGLERSQGQVTEGLCRGISDLSLRLTETGIIDL